METFLKYDPGHLGQSVVKADCKSFLGAAKVIFPYSRRHLALWLELELYYPSFGTPEDRKKQVLKINSRYNIFCDVIKYYLFKRIYT